MKTNFRKGLVHGWLLGLLVVLLAGIMPQAPAYAASMTKGWLPLGAAGFSTGEASYVSMAVDGSGVPYVAYADGANGNKITVKKYTGGGWTTVGSEGISAGAAKEISLVFKDNNPYVLYIENPCKVMIKRFVSGSWQGGQVATAEHAAISVCNHNYLYISATTTQAAGGYPYYEYRYVSKDGSTMAYSNGSGSTYAGSIGNNPAVASDSAGWGYFSDGSTLLALPITVCGNNNQYGTQGSPIMQSFSQIAPDSNEGAYVAGKGFSGSADLQYIGENYLHYALSFTGCFRDLGGSAGSADYVSFKLNNSNIPYLAYSDGTSDWKATVRKLDGGWQDLGTKGFTPGTAKYTSLALLDSTTPCIAFQDGANGNKTSVYKYTDCYAVTFNSNGGTNEPVQYTASSGKIQAPPAPQKTGYTFANWCTDAELTTPFDFNTPITDSITLYAKWNPLAYTVSFNMDGGSEVANQKVNYNEKATKPSDPTKTGYTFGGWYKDSGFKTAFNFDTAITADTTVYAKWTINSYTVSFNTDGGDTVASQKVNYNEKATKPATDPTKTGYTFGGWYADSGYTKAFSFDTAITADTTIYAKWTINSYAVHFNVEGGSPVSVQTVNYNAKATRPADPTKTGYTFGGWYTDSGCTTAFNFDTPITAVIFLHAKWIITVSFDVDGGSAVASQIVNRYGKATKPADPTKTGYTFGGWYADSGFKTVFNFDTAITVNTTIYAKWNASYTVTFKDWDGRVLLTQSVETGKGATAPANPTREGYTFTGWNKSFDNVTSDLTVTALYSQNKSVTGISVSPAEAEIEKGKTITLTAGVSPEDATNKAVIWSSDKESIATVDANGTVTGVGVGTAIITATTADGGCQATCTVTVKEAGTVPSGGGGGGESFPIFSATPSYFEQFFYNF